MQLWFPDTGRNVRAATDQLQRQLLLRIRLVVSALMVASRVKREMLCHPWAAAGASETVSETA